MRNLYLLRLFATLFSLSAHAQQPFAIKPYAITLPRVTTAQQNSPTTVPQQAGNVVYNTDQQAVAVNIGGSWNYLGTGASTNGQFKNFRAFIYGLPSVWTIPPGVEYFMVEMWGGGAGGDIYQQGVPWRTCSGGFAGGYVRKVIPVVAGANSVTVTLGLGGNGAERANGGVSARARGNGSSSVLRYNGSTLEAGGATTSYPGLGQDNFPGGGALMLFGGGPKEMSLTYGQKSATEFVQTIKGQSGGTAYGIPTDMAGSGMTFTITSSGTLESFNNYYDTTNNYTPGGGGGCGYFYGGDAGAGVAIIYW